MDFIGSLTGNRFPFRLLQSPELVELNNEKYIVTRDTWGLAGPDTRDFAERLIDCFQFTGKLFYQDVRKAAYHADQVVLHLPKKFFNEAPVSQEQAWSAWLLADAARQAIEETDDKNIHVKLPALPTVTAFSRKVTWLTSFLSENRPWLTLSYFVSVASLSSLHSLREMKSRKLLLLRPSS